MIPGGAAHPLQLISSAELAEIFGVEERTLLDWRRQYGWPCLRVGRRVRFTQAMVEEILAAHSESGAKAAADDAAGGVLAGQSKGSAARSRRSA